MNNRKMKRRESKRRKEKRGKKRKKKIQVIRLREVENKRGVISVFLDNFLLGQFLFNKRIIKEEKN